MGLLDDLNLMATTTLPLTSVGDTAKIRAYYRLRDFIQQHEPWYPPQPEGFGPWIEYKPGDKGPHVGDVVHILYAAARENKSWPRNSGYPAGCAYDGWLRERNHIVAYCVKLDEAKP